MLEYPNFGDMRAVRPTIRAHEGALNALASKGERPQPTRWGSDFWAEAFRKTRDDHVRLPRKLTTAAIGITADRLRELFYAVLGRSDETV